MFWLENSLLSLFGGDAKHPLGGEASGLQADSRWWFLRFVLFIFYF